jgi:serine/threonine protein kinase
LFANGVGIHIFIKFNSFLHFCIVYSDLATLLDNHYKQHQSSPFRESEVKQLMRQLLEAIAFLHSRCIIHRDLKCSNLLYNHRGEMKVADFGLSRRIGRDNDVNDHSKPYNLTPKVVSLWYRPPELLFGLERYDQGVDIFGAGCIMGELLLGRPVMDGRNEMDQIQKMFDFLGPPNEDEWPGLKRMPVFRSGEMELPKQWHNRNTGKHMLDVFRRWKRTAGIKLLSGLLKYNPNHRWKAVDAMDAEWFLEMPCPTPLSLMPTFPTKHNKTP